MMPARSPQPGWRLGELLQGMARVRSVDDCIVSGLAMDSRQVSRGGLFLACAGEGGHGLDYLQGALARGAVALAWEPAPGRGAPRVPDGVAVIEVPDLGQQAGAIADRYFGHPSADLDVIGVTGTDGKTSISHIIAAALDSETARCGVMGTLGSGFHGELQPATHTTPDAVSVHRTLHGLRAAGARRVAMEVSSHALVQGRVNAVRFTVAVFSNLSRDHLDYHGNLEAYAQAKRRLFEPAGAAGAVVNLDDALGRSLALELAGQRRRVLGVTLEDAAVAGVEALRIMALRPGPGGLSLRVATPQDGEGELSTRLLGRFNAFNLALALGVLLELGIALPDALGRLAATPTVPGRMEAFGGGRGPLVVVDYAHTPAALEHALRALREHVPGRIWCVFGCGGDRDRGKRPLMGAAAERVADHVVVTDDNPRSEPPQAIVADILSGMEQPAGVSVEHDRRTAIGMALAAAREGDAVLVAGKGHEQSQVVAGRSLPFSDRETVARLLGEVPR